MCGPPDTEHAIFYKWNSRISVGSWNRGATIYLELNLFWETKLFFRTNWKLVFGELETYLLELNLFFELIENASSR